MPIYEYECDKCSKRNEKIFNTVIFDADKQVECECGGVLVRVPSCYSFKVNGYSEANGYASKRRSS